MKRQQQKAIVLDLCPAGLNACKLGLSPDMSSYEVS
jgi:hypothetical protein